MQKERAVLLVEDNPDDEELTIRALRKSGMSHRIDVARDGAEALGYLFGDAGVRALPDLILLDLKLPKVSGLDVLQRIRSADRTALIPVVVLTTSSEEQDILRSYRSGANSYIRKPVDFDRFVEAAGHLGVYWLTLNQVVRS